MHSDYRYVFISYSARNYDSALELKNLLNINNIDCWMAPQSIPAGSDYASEIPQAIENCSVFVLYLSEEAQQSQWVPKELDLAITNAKPIIPFHMDASDLKAAFNFRLTNVQRIEAYGRFSEACNELVRQIFALWGEAAGAAAAPVEPSNTIGELTPGKIIAGKYRIIRQVGVGPLTKVYLAENIVTKAKWAVKAISKAPGNQDRLDVFLKMSQTEFQFVSKLKHSCVPSVVDIIEDPHMMMVIMEYIEGRSLDMFVSEYGPAEEAQILSCAKQLFEGLDYLHTRKPPILHNDVRPQNIIRKEDGQIVLIDFGIAREYTGEEKNTDTVALGTLGYASPEQLSGKPDFRSDIFAAGSVLYYLATGRSPAEPPYGIYPVRQMRPELSPGLEYIINKCTQQDPSDRYQSAREVLVDLEQIDALSTRLKKKTFLRNLFRFGK